jgi:aryl-alcohol dehydrogenase-like predicted oxidoreductase
MRTRKLGYTDLHLTTVGLGTWSYSGPWAYGWGPQDDADSIAAIRRAVDLGVNWLDTAAIYGFGHSEEVVGQALQGLRDRVIVATKCGRTGDRAAGTVSSNLAASFIRQEIENSLRRLQTDYVDLYQIHWPIPDEQIEEGWGAVADLVKEGKARFAGVSNFSPAQMHRLQPIHPIASLQPPYSMLRREVEAETLSFCAANGIGVIAYSPMQAGLLTGRFSKARAAALQEDDWRSRNDFFKEPRLSAILALVEQLRPIAAREGVTLSQLAIAWVLRRPELTAAIVGARRPTQIEETAPASDWEMPPAVAGEIEALLAGV